MRVRKPKTRRGRRILLNREPKTIEDAKNAIFIEGRKCSASVKGIMKDFFQFKKPHVKMMRHNNDFTPFEDSTPLEQLSEKNDCTHFFFGSHSKKRPENLIVGRLYEHQVLDMVELAIKSFKPLQDFKVEKISAHVKPCIIFNGYKWKLTEELRRLRNLLLDVFHKEPVDAIRLQGLEHVISFTVAEDMTIHMRSYRILLKKSGQKTPRIELEEIGPSINFTIRRTKIASKDLYKTALRKPAPLKVTKKKNVRRDELGNVHGRVHVGRQDVTTLQTRKMKGLKKTPEERRAERKAKKRVVQETQVEFSMQEE